jgi:hypothetical protein
MHLGNFLKIELEKRGLSKAYAGRELNKTGSAIEKDLKKETLHQEVIEQWSKFLDINLFRLLASEFEGSPYSFQPSPSSQVSEPTEAYQKNSSTQKIEILSMQIAVPEDKKEQILQLLIG